MTNERKVDGWMESVTKQMMEELGEPNWRDAGDWYRRNDLWWALVRNDGLIVHVRKEAGDIQQEAFEWNATSADGQTGYRYAAHHVRITSADSPTPTEAAAQERKRVVEELREWAIAKIHNTAHSPDLMTPSFHPAELIAKLNQLAGEE